MTILFSSGAGEVFAELPRPVKVQAAKIIELLMTHPFMCPVRKLGVMKGYRYFIAAGYLFYYSVTSSEIRVSAILPGRMRRA